jgi:hypothetical protein
MVPQDLILNCRTLQAGRMHAVALLLRPVSLASCRPLADYLAQQRSFPGAIGLAAQIAFGLVPAIQGRWPSDSPRP